VSLPKSPRRALTALALLTVACADPNVLRLSTLPPTAAAPAAAPTTIGAGDLLAVRVWNAEQMTTTQRVTADGRVSLFFLDSLAVAGRTPAEVSREIAARLDGVLVAPHVTVVVEESAAAMFAVVGEVARPGRYVAQRPLRVLEALAMAGGLSEYARRDQIIVQRPGGGSIRVTWRELVRGDDRRAALLVGPGDVLVVR
jgi:polysaccharide export outer membrane protein